MNEYINQVAQYLNSTVVTTEVISDLSSQYFKNDLNSTVVTTEV